MLKKSLLCGALALVAMNPLVSSAADTAKATVKTVKMERTDAEITAAIKGLYAESALNKASDIQVETRNHEVELIGNLKTDLQYADAVALAQSVDGVEDVKAKKLVVEGSKAPLADTYITAKAKGTIMKEKLFGSKAVEYWPVSFETKDGILYVTGKVDTDKERENIVNLVKRIHGVKEVKSTITVK